MPEPKTDDIFAIEGDQKRLEFAVLLAVYIVVWPTLYFLHRIRLGPDGFGLFDFVWPALFVVFGVSMLLTGIGSMKWWEFAAPRPAPGTAWAYFVVKTGFIVLSVAAIGVGVLSIADAE